MVAGCPVDATDAIDATDTAVVGETAVASTTDKPKWYILDLTETHLTNNSRNLGNAK
jgi:hypothetical protein